MENQDAVPAYYIWGVDSTAYGPVELPTLVNWIKEERVIANTWLYSELAGGWCKAADAPELQMFFKPKSRPESVRPDLIHSDAQITPGALRRIKVLAEMSDPQLAALLGLVEVISVRPFTHLVHRGDPGNELYGIIEGEMRSAILMEGKEVPVATLSPGSIFGEISLFDKGPHAADVLSNQESMLVKISGDAIARLSQEAPDAALALLSGLIKAIAGRVRTLTRRYETSVQMAQKAEGIRAVAPTAMAVGP
jgi:CRP-like cAMP-binding protein